MTAKMYSTIKAANAAGFRELLPYHYGGEQITVKGKRFARSPKEARSVRVNILALPLVEYNDGTVKNFGELVTGFTCFINERVR